jgi:hypothetical protein
VHRADVNIKEIPPVRVAQAYTGLKTSTRLVGRGTLPGEGIVSKATSPGLCREAVPTLSSLVGRGLPGAS